MFVNNLYKLIHGYLLPLYLSPDVPSCFDVFSIAIVVESPDYPYTVPVLTLIQLGLGFGEETLNMFSPSVCVPAWGLERRTGP